MATLTEPKPLAARQAASAGRVSIMTIFGTRPEAVKMAPVVQRLRASAEFAPVVVTTGQHREMLDQVTRLFGITPDVGELRAGAQPLHDRRHLQDRKSTRLNSSH